MHYVGIILMILAIIILAISIAGVLKKPESNGKDDRNEYLRTAIRKLRGEGRQKPGNWDWLFKSEFEKRRDYYLNEYLKSEAWSRKRHMVLERDHWRCVCCGGRATQVHHTKYAKKNIGSEPIDWLVSVCKQCHDSVHRK